MFFFNDALNTFNLRLYGIGHMVKYHLDSQRENLYYIAILSNQLQGMFYMLHPTDRIAHTMAKLVRPERIYFPVSLWLYLCL